MENVINNKFTIVQDRDAYEADDSELNREDVNQNGASSQAKDGGESIRQKAEKPQYDAYVFVYDVSNRESFRQLSQVMRMISDFEKS